jgi:hypothetical protein
MSVKKISGREMYVPFIRIGNTFRVIIHLSENRLPADLDVAMSRKVVLHGEESGDVIMPSDIAWEKGKVTFSVNGNIQKALGRYTAEVSYLKTGGGHSECRIWDGAVFVLVAHSWQQNFPGSGDSKIDIPTIEIGGILQYGQDGESAYQIAARNGFAGSESQWLASLNGKKGDAGTPGRNGTDGKSAYDIAVDNGFEGSASEWLASLKGEGLDYSTLTEEEKEEVKGKSAYDIAVEQGFVGSQAEWLVSLEGKDGNNGKDGTDGDDGADGKSAYDIAVDDGFEGTEAEWLASLKGEPGDSGTNDHAQLLNRDQPDQHPIDSITGLRGALDARPVQGLEILRWFGGQDGNIHVTLSDIPEGEIGVDSFEAWNLVTGEAVAILSVDAIGSEADYVVAIEPQSDPVSMEFLDTTK